MDTSLSFLILYGATAGRKVKYVSNSNVVTQPLIEKYYNPLGLEYAQQINLIIIRKAFHKKLEFSTDDRLRVYKPTYSLEELPAAKAYKIDFYNYHC